MATPRSDKPSPQPQGGIRLPSRAAVLAVLADLAKLRRPVTAGAVAATLAALLSPLGLNVGPDGAYLLGALGTIGLIAGLIEQARKGG
jgi:hypothetical protein